MFSERQNHARELVREADLSQWGALVIMSGDGLLFEVSYKYNNPFPTIIQMCILT